MCTHNQCLSKNEKNIIIFHLKINIFAAVKYCCILHGRVFVMRFECGFTCHEECAVLGHVQGDNWTEYIIIDNIHGCPVSGVE